MAIKDKKISKSLKPVANKVAKVGKGLFGTLVKIGRYFKGSWTELRQVRWPDRRSTWGLTIAVILFTLFFVALIILLDYVAKLLFELILK